MNLLSAALLAATTLATVVAGVKHAVDVSSTPVTSKDAVKCLENKVAHNEDNFFYSYINIRMGNSSGYMQSGMDTMWNALDNINQIDCLIDICPKKINNTYDTVTEILVNLKNSAHGYPLNKIQYVFMSAMIGDEDCWYTSGNADDVKKNIAALDDGMRAIRAQQKYLGVKTNKQNWTALTDDWTGISAGGWQLWWASEGPASFDGYEPFGGWARIPALRQFQTGATKCNSSVNLNVARDDFVCNLSGQDCDDGCCGGGCGEQEAGKCPYCAKNGLFLRC